MSSRFCKTFVIVAALAALLAADKPAAEKPADARAAAKARAVAKIGEPAPTFKLKDYAGKAFDLADHQDKIVVLEWFNKDCPFCKMFCDDLKKTAAAYAKKGVVWVAVDSTNFRTDEENAAYAKEHKIDYPILNDFDGKVGHMFGAKTTPHVFVIDKGKLVYAGAFLDMGKKKTYVADALDAVIAGKEPSPSKTKPFG